MDPYENLTAITSAELLKAVVTGVAFGVTQSESGGPDFEELNATLGHYLAAQVAPFGVTRDNLARAFLKMATQGPSALEDL